MGKCQKNYLNEYPKESTKICVGSGGFQGVSREYQSVSEKFQRISVVSQGVFSDISGCLKPFSASFRGATEWYKVVLGISEGFDGITGGLRHYREFQSTCREFERHYKKF